MMFDLRRLLPLVSMTYLVLPACGDGLLGKFETTDSEGESGDANGDDGGLGTGTTTTTGGDSQGSATTGSVTSTSTSTSSSTSTSTSDGGSSSSAGETSAGSESSGGGVFACENPQFTCSEPYACGEPGGFGECGGRTRFDDDGCLRLSCDSHDDCDGDDFCYRGMDWGDCVGSGFGCSDENGDCQCFGTDDCGGAYCVPPEVYPLPADSRVTLETATEGRVAETCGPVDQPILDIRLGVVPTACDEWEDSDVSIWLAVDREDDNGVHTLISAEVEGYTASEGIVRTQIEGGTVSGSFELLVDRVLYLGRFEDLSLCDFDIYCP